VLQDTKHNWLHGGPRHSRWILTYSKNTYVYLYIKHYESSLFSFLNRSVSARFTMCSKKNRVCIFDDIILWDPPSLFVYLLAVPCAATHGAQLFALCKTQEREHIYNISTQMCVPTIIWICSLYHVPQNTEHNCAGHRKGKKLVCIFIYIILWGPPFFFFEQKCICSLSHVLQDTERIWLHCHGHRKGNTREI